MLGEKVVPEGVNLMRERGRCLVNSSDLLYYCNPFLQRGLLVRCQKTRWKISAFQ